MKRILPLPVLILGLAGSAGADPRGDFARYLDGFPSTKGKMSESERVNDLYKHQWDYSLLEFPEAATSLGVPGRNDRWTDQSLAASKARETLIPKLLAAAESIDRDRLEPKDRVSYDLFLRGAKADVEGMRFPYEYLAISQLGGLQQSVPGVLIQAPTATVKDYEDILARLRAIPAIVDQNLERLEKGLAAGVTPPKITLRDVPGQVEALTPDDPMKSALLEPFTRIPESIPAPDRARLTRDAVQAYQEQVVPALRKLHRYLSETYVPGARESIAMSALPDGQAWYAYNVKQVTTTDLTPQQIHELGLSEVKRIHGEMDKVIASTGFKGSFEEFLTFLRTDPRFFYDKPEDLVTGYRDVAKRVDPELVKLFGRLPRLPYGVRPIPAYAEKSQTTAYYEDGNPEAGRPGYYSVNTYDLKSRPKWEMEALTLHEAVPGHHLQISLAQELQDVPEWRKYQGYTVFVEGWALYAESLGEEIGMYKDPYSKFGQLAYEMWRACRLVVDTGMHSMGWTREQAIDYMLKNSGKTEHDIIVEVDRYIVNPGQALAYKIGELRIKELRAYAKKELGDSFDVRAFHDQVLGNGAVPIDVLEKNIRTWVGERKAAVAK
ncbi:MAG TPA: DUF885 domain-containing protein [Thermoanaerobaculia bacterium]|jgi:uncharacterized protein (DUF885 family)|nr:DUF885 domain-containing protein [Thermoanaerobaculia bacterium]